MIRAYYYYNIVFPVSDHEDVFFRVKFISNGNAGKTIVNVPGPNDSFIKNEGDVFIGKGWQLRNGTTVVVSRVRNPLPMTLEDKIIVRFFLNEQLVSEQGNAAPVPHTNSKEEADEVDIFMFINFITR